MDQMDMNEIQLLKEKIYSRNKTDKNELQLLVQKIKIQMDSIEAILSQSSPSEIIEKSEYIKKKLYEMYYFDEVMTLLKNDMYSEVEELDEKQRNLEDLIAKAVNSSMDGQEPTTTNTPAEIKQNSEIEQEQIDAKKSDEETH